MAQNIDLPPLYDPIVENSPADKLHMTDIWMNYFSFFIQTLIGYLSESGIYLPKLPAVAGAGELSLAVIEAPYTAIIGSPLGDLPDISGLTLFDTTNRVPKVFVITFAGVNVATATWKTYVLI